MTLPATALDSPTNPWVFVAWFGCLCGVYVFCQGIHLLRRRKRKDTPGKIREATPGPVFVAGSVEGPSALKGALSNKPCLYYRATVWRQQESSDDWEIVAQECKGRPFIVNDQTGCILVDPNGVEVDLPRDTYEEYGKTLLATFTDVPASVEQFLSRNKVDTSAALRVEEYLLAPGTEIFVHGMAAVNPQRPSKGSSRKTKPAPRESAAKQTAAQTIGVLPQVIQLSPEPVATPATEMTMQSRVAAALALARTRSSSSAADPVPNSAAQGPLRIPNISVTMFDPNTAGQASRSEEDGKKQRAQDSVAADSPKPEAQPPLIIRQKDGSRFTISYRSVPVSVAISVRRGATLLVAGPVITFASAYFLLANLGWL